MCPIVDVAVDLEGTVLEPQGDHGHGFGSTGQGLHAVEGEDRHLSGSTSGVQKSVNEV
jgi:hypothetical protein